MSSIGLFAAVILIATLSMLVIEIVYRRSLSQWRTEHEMGFIIHQSLLMFVIFNMALILLFDAVGEKLWTSGHQLVIAICAGLAWLFGAAFLQPRVNKV